MEGVQGTPYKIRNRSNKAYALDTNDIPLLEGVYETEENLQLTYNVVEVDEETEEGE